MATKFPPSGNPPNKVEINIETLHDLQGRIHNIEKEMKAYRHETEMRPLIDKYNGLVGDQVKLKHENMVKCQNEWGKMLKTIGSDDASKFGVNPLADCPSRSILEPSNELCKIEKGGYNTIKCIEYLISDMEDKK